MSAPNGALHAGNLTPTPPYLSKELGDLLPAFQQMSIPVRIVRPVDYIDPCSVCGDNADNYGPPAESVAEIVRLSHDGRVYREPSCASCLVPAVSWELQYRTVVTVEVPLSIGVAA